MDIDATIVLQLGLFLVTLLTLTKTLLQPVIGVLEARHQKIEGAQGEAVRLEKLAGENRDAYLARIREARNVQRRERDLLRSQANDDKRKLLAAVRADIARALNEHQVRIEASEIEARRNLTQDTEAMARALVSRVLGREI